MDSKAIFADSVDLYSNALDLYSLALGRYHNVSTDRSFWEPIIGPWLLHLSTLYAARIEKNDDELLVKEVGVFSSVLKLNVVSQDWQDFIGGFNEKKFNRALRIFFSGVEHIDIGDDERYSITNKLDLVRVVLQSRRFILRYLHNGLRSILSHVLLMLLHLDGSKRYVYYDASLLSKRQIISLLFTSRGRILPFLKNHSSAKYSREVARDEKTIERFLTYFSDRIDVHMRNFILFSAIWLPFAYLENFSSIYSRVKKMAIYRPSLFVLTIGQYGNEFLKFSLGYWARQGVPIFIEQHGAGYGLVEYSSYEYYELRVARRFLAWGKGFCLTKAYKVMPSLRLSNFQENYFLSSGADSQSMLYLCAMLPKFSTETISSSPFAGEQRSLSRKSFVLHCPKAVKTMICVRPHYHYLDIYGTDDSAIFSEFGFKIQDKGVSTYDAFHSAKVLIFESISTGVFEAFAVSKPFLLFIPWVDVLLLSREGEKFIEYARRAGILFDDEQKFFNFLLYDLNHWLVGYQSNKRINEMRSFYLSLSSHPVKDWIDMLREENYVD